MKKSSFKRIIPFTLIGFLAIALASHATTKPRTADVPRADSTELSTYLPIILINAGGQKILDEPKIKAKMQIIHHGGSTINHQSDVPNIYNGDIGIEIRGTSSAHYPQTPYAIETRDSLGSNLDTILLEMPGDNDWVLLSNWNEKSFARNILAFDIFRKMGHYAPRVKLCEVMVDNDYRGIYLFGEKIKQDKGRVNIASLTPLDITGDSVTGGYIFKTDYDDGTGSFWVSDFAPANQPVGSVRFAYHDPKPKNILPEQKEYISGYVDMTEQVLYSEDFTNPASGYRAYLDINSFIDYWILQEVSRNVDGYKKSRYFYKNKDSKNRLIGSGPVWDYDWAWKNLDDCYFLSNTKGEGWAYKINECNVVPVPPSWEVRMMQDSVFSNAINARYFSLRKSVLSLSQINRTIDSVAGLVKEAQVRHYEKYKILGIDNSAPEIDTIARSYAGEIQKLKSWIAVRLNWLDANMVGTRSTLVEIKHQAIIRIFPNPVQKVVFVESDNPIKEISIFNPFGAILLTVKPDQPETSVNVQHLKSGLYIIKASLSDGTSFTRTLIKN